MHVHSSGLRPPLASDGISPALQQDSNTAALGLDSFLNSFSAATAAPVFRSVSYRPDSPGSVSILQEALPQQPSGQQRCSPSDGYLQNFCIYRSCRARCSDAVAQQRQQVGSSSRALPGPASTPCLPSSLAIPCHLLPPPFLPTGTRRWGHHPASPAFHPPRWNIGSTVSLVLTTWTLQSSSAWMVLGLLCL